jgi:hypothetical protein
MDHAKLKLHACLLEDALLSNKERSADVDYLIEYEPLIRALKDAKEGSLTSPRKLGLAYWEVESNIRDIPDVSHRLAQFELLFEGWQLPSDSVGG